MKPIRFQSSLAETFETFVRLRQTTGRDYEDQAYLLSRFDRFLVEQNLSGPRVTREMTVRYQESLTHLAPSSQYNRFCVVRQVCEYLALDDPKSDRPQPMRHVNSSEAHVPYHYSPEQVQALLKAAETLEPAHSLFPHTAKTFLGLLVTTGVRTGEALAFNLEDFDVGKEALLIKQGKFRKARWIPLDPSTTQALKRYLERRTSRPCEPHSPLFLNRQGSRLSHGCIYRTFRQLLEKCGIRHRPYLGPRLHDFRHTFAVQRLLQWYREGLEINSRLPALATYMGHSALQHTTVYLKATPQLTEQVKERYHRYFINHVQSKGDQS